MQLLAYKVFSKFFPDSDAAATVSLEKRCFEDMKKYLSVNSDCKRYEVLGQFFSVEQFSLKYSLV